MTSTKAFLEELKIAIGDCLPNWEVLEVNCQSRIPSKTCPYRNRKAACIEALNVPTELYDYKFAQPDILVDVRFPIAVFLIESSSFDNVWFRNLFVHWVDAAGVRSDITVIPVSFGPNFDEVHQHAKHKPDEHLVHSLLRSHLFFSASQVTEVSRLISTVVDQLPEEKAIWRRCRVSWQLATYLLILSGSIYGIAVISSIASFVVSLFAIVSGQKLLAGATGMIAGYSALIVLGFNLACPLPSAAFEKFRSNFLLSRRKRAIFRNSQWIWSMIATIMIIFTPMSVEILSSEHLSPWSNPSGGC